MVVLKIFIFLSFFSDVNLFELSLSKNANNYGPYNVKWKRYETCSGPKTVNLTTYTTSLMEENDTYVGDLNFTFLAPARIEEVKITVYSVKNNRNSLLWSYKLNDPCQHYVFASLIEKELHTKNCAVKKGSYYSSMNFTEITHQFFGTSFFYGEFRLKVTSISKKGNILCLLLNIIFVKKESK